MAWLVGVLMVAVLATGACGGHQQPLRIGVIVDCVGEYRSLLGAEMAGAELPLAQRGGHVVHGDPLIHVAGARIGGRPVEIVRGCSDLLEYSQLTSEIRRLVQNEHVDAVVAGSVGTEGLVMREVARRYPHVVFVPAVDGPRDITLHRPAPNLYRVADDRGQGVAGLATYAYRTLGWRRAAVFVQEWDVGWGERETFVKEFCALGGQVTQVGVSFFNPDHPDADVKLVPRNVDGVAVFAPSLLGPAAFLTGLAHSLHDPARQMVVGPSVVDDPDLMRATRRALTGVVASSELPDAGRSPVMRAYQRAMAQTFPGIPADSARSAIVLGYRNAVEFLARGLQRAGGDPTRLPAALATLHTNLTGAPMHLDANRQVVGTTTIVKIGPPPKAQSDPGLVPLATIPNVDESTGGLVAPSVQTKFGPVACRRATPPPWSR